MADASDKTCSKCGQTKPSAAFYASQPSRCKLCAREYARQYVFANREQIKQKKRQYYLANRDAESKARPESDRLKHNAYIRALRAANRERYRAYDKRRTPEQIQSHYARSRARYAANRDQFRAEGRERYKHRKSTVVHDLLTEKTCSKCGETKAGAAFYALGGNQCKRCLGELTRRWQAANPERLSRYRLIASQRQRSAAALAKFAERKAAYRKAYRKDFPEREKARRAAAYKRSKVNLTDCFVKMRLARNNGLQILRYAAISPELVAAKKAHIKLKRFIKEQRNEHRV